MNESLLTGHNVIVQGITGAHGSFHTRTMVAAGTHIVAGTTPGKAGQDVDGIPVYDSIADIQAQMPVDISVIFVPAPFAKSAILEAITAKVPLIVCITEGIPIHDMLQIKQHLEKSESKLIGPNCPGILMPGVTKLGIIPAPMGLSYTADPSFSQLDAMQGDGEARNEPYQKYGEASTGTDNEAERRVRKGVGIVSRSGTLTYEAMAGLTARGIGQKYVIGIGGDPVNGTSFTDCLELFQNDPDVDRIVLIGEIGGTSEYDAAGYIADHVTKPVYAYVTGHHAPEGVQLGHAGAILNDLHESASAKTAFLAKSGANIATNLMELLISISTD